MEETLEHIGVGQLEVNLALARIDFYEFCKLIDPEFYTEDMPHLHHLCNVLNDFHYAKLLNEEGTVYDKLMIRMPPQHGKSRTLVNFTKWTLGRNNRERIITASYSNDSASDFSRYTRDGIAEEKNLEEQIVYSDVFPDVRISETIGSIHKWALQGQHFSYMGVGVGGGVTGKGATLRICDDIVKDAETATSENALGKIWQWYAGTYSSRNAAGGGRVKEIFCATMWSKLDPQYILQESEKGLWYIFEMPVMKNGNMLCDKIMNMESYLKLKARMLRSKSTASIFWANYHCETIDEQNSLYKDFLTYKTIDKEDIVYAYTDTADMGKDHLCSVAYIKKDNMFYIIDVVYTQDPNEISEKMVVDMHIRKEVNYSLIESNNGGRAFARNIERMLRENNYFKTKVEWFTQSKNKLARIRSNSSNIMNQIVMPHDWQIRWSEFAKDLSNYIGESASEKDDAPDVLTGIVENVKSNKPKIIW